MDRPTGDLDPALVEEAFPGPRPSLAWYVAAGLLAPIGTAGSCATGLSGGGDWLFGDLPGVWVGGALALLYAAFCLFLVTRTRQRRVLLPVVGLVLLVLGYFLGGAAASDHYPFG